MGLSNNLLTQFAKVVVEAEKKKETKEIIHYGTVVKNGEAFYVQLDGSDSLTPFSSTTTVKDGDRVTVTIDNHTAVLTGNISQPSATDKDVQEFKTNTAENFTNIRSDISVVDSKVNVQRSDITALDSTVKINKSNIEAVQSDISAVKVDVDSQNVKITAQDTTISTMNDKIDSQNNEISAISNKVDAQNTSITTMNTTVNAINTRVDTQDTKIEAANSSIEVFNSNFKIEDGVVTGIKGAETDWIKTNYIDAVSGDIEELKSKGIDVEKLKADFATIDLANIDTANVDVAVVNELVANSSSVQNLDANYVKINLANINSTTINDLIANTATILNLDTKYADIDFANIRDAGIKRLFSDSGIIKDLTIKDGIVTGELNSVTINADLINANTIKADKLMFKGEDGLYYKLNTDGETVASAQTDYNSLNGQVIMAQSITANKISVSDLFAFAATIGGLQIDEENIHSTNKISVDSEIAGFYLDKEGQLCVGDNKNHIKYSKDENNEYSFEIVTGGMLFNIGDTNEKLNNINTDINRYNSWVTFSDEDDENPYMMMGTNTSSYKIKITNEEIQFLKGENELSRFDTDELIIEKANINKTLGFSNTWEWMVHGTNENFGLIRKKIGG